MATNTERILDAIARAEGASDSELRAATGIQPHQQVNQICRALERRGLIERRPRPDGRIGNFPAGPSGGPPLRPPIPEARPARTNSTPARHLARLCGELPSAESALVVVPCSKAKARGGDPDYVGPSTLDLIDSELANSLSSARRALAPKIALDERGLLPAWRRYSGHFAEAAATSLGELTSANHLAILSGGYGLLLGAEPTGWYERQFRRSDWPRGLLESCLVSLAKSLGVTQVISFCSETTAYAQILRRASWRSAGLTSMLVTPALEGRGGAQRAAPRTAGFALQAFLRGGLDGRWRSDEGIGVSVEVLA